MPINTNAPSYSKTTSLSVPKPKVGELSSQKQTSPPTEGLITTGELQRENSEGTDVRAGTAALLAGLEDTVTLSAESQNPSMLEGLQRYIRNDARAREDSRPEMTRDQKLTTVLEHNAARRVKAEELLKAARLLEEKSGGSVWGKANPFTPVKALRLRADADRLSQANKRDGEFAKRLANVTFTRTPEPKKMSEGEFARRKTALQKMLKMNP